jgi:hypothetical protein
MPELKNGERENRALHDYSSMQLQPWFHGIFAMVNLRSRPKLAV